MQQVNYKALRVVSLLSRILQVEPAFYSNSTTSLNRRCLHSSLSVKMPIKVGDKVPNSNLFEGTPGGKISTDDLLKGKKVVIFGVPGAYTPGCTKTHLPGYVSQADEIKNKGINEIVCVSVNDPFVMAAWGDANSATGKVRMLADTSAEFVKAIDVAFDLPPLGGTRSKRFAMLVDDGVVKAIDIEPDNTGLTCSLSNNFLKNL